jgi:4-hydroxy-tetrahydrodipicolinate reductase
MMKSTLPIAIAGASGRMGKMLIETVLASQDATLVGALDIAQSPAIGQDAGMTLGNNTGVLITHDFSEGLAKAEYLIDFTRPEGTIAMPVMQLPMVSR